MWFRIGPPILEVYSNLTNKTMEGSGAFSGDSDSSWLGEPSDFRRVRIIPAVRRGSRLFESIQDCRDFLRAELPWLGRSEGLVELLFRYTHEDVDTEQGILQFLLDYLY